MRRKPLLGVDESSASDTHSSSEEGSASVTHIVAEDAAGEAYVDREADDRYVPMPDELARIREEYGDELGRDERYFRTSVLRGRWTELHTGDWWDRLECTPRSGLPTLWCRKYLYCSRISWPRKNMEKLER